MSFLGFLSSLDLQNFALSCPELLVKLSAIGIAVLLPNIQRKLPCPPPEFKLGDLVAYDWERDDDEPPGFVTDFGEILGMRWVPEPDGYSSASNSWIYFVRWTHTTWDEYSSCYPCYDGEPTLFSDLRLVNAEEICKH
jgi:hypothetical protein